MQEMRNSRYEANMRVINGTLSFPATGPSLPLPRTRRRAMRMKMRIVDFLNDQGAKFAIEAWARRLGFQTVIVDYAAVEQPSCECGYIAARVMAILRSAGALWDTVHVASANHPHWVFVGNQLLNLASVPFAEGANRLGVHWLGEESIMKLAAVWDPRNDEGDALIQPARWEFQTTGMGQLPWMAVGTLDAIIRRVAEAVEGGETIPESAPMLLVLNTEDCRSSGYHLISVALSIEYDDDSTGDGAGGPPSPCRQRLDNAAD